MGVAGTSVKQRRQVLNILWFAKTSTVGVYWVVHAIVKAKQPHSSSGAMVGILAGLSVVESLGAWMFHHLMLKDVAKNQAGALSPEACPAIERQLQSTAVVCLALFETIAVYGFIGSLLGSPYPNTFEWFAGISFLNLVLYRAQAYPAIFQLLDQMKQRQLA